MVDAEAMTRAAEHPGRLLDRIRRDRGTRPLTAVVMVALGLGVYAAAVGIGLLFGRSGPPGLCSRSLPRPSSRWRSNRSGRGPIAFSLGSPGAMRSRRRRTCWRTSPTRSAVDTRPGAAPTDRRDLGPGHAGGARQRYGSSCMAGSSRLPVARVDGHEFARPAGPRRTTVLAGRDRARRALGRADGGDASGPGPEPRRTPAVRGRRGAGRPDPARGRPPYGARTAPRRARAALRRPAPLPSGDRHPAGRRATAAGARHPRRSPTRGSRPAGQPAARADAARPRAGPRRRRSRAAGSGDAGDHPHARGAVPRPVPGDPRRVRAGPRPAGRGGTRGNAHHDRRAGAAPPAVRRRDHALLRLSRGAAERGEARQGNPGHGADSGAARRRRREDRPDRGGDRRRRRGFRYNGPDVHRGRGLENLRDRVDAAHGNLDITSAPGAGTRLVFSLPCSWPVLPAPVFPAPVFPAPDGGSA